jgi:hypothetical protein
MQCTLCAQCVQISDPWLASAVLDLGTKRPDLIDKPRGWPLPIYDCFDRVRLSLSVLCWHWTRMKWRKNAISRALRHTAKVPVFLALSG